MSYTASADKGYVANVRYEGEAVFPDEPPPARSRRHHKAHRYPFRKIASVL